MSKNAELFTIEEVCQYYGLSEQTIRRRIKDSKQGIGTFPRPIFGYGRKALWKRSEIESWSESMENNNNENKQ